MRILYLLVLLAVAIVAVAFTAQNDVEVAVRFFGLSASGSLSLVLVVTLSIGIIIGLLIMAPSVFKRALSASGLRKRLAKAEKLGAGASVNAAGQAVAPAQPSAGAVDSAAGQSGVPSSPRPVEGAEGIAAQAPAPKKRHR